MLFESEKLAAADAERAAILKRTGLTEADFEDDPKPEAEEISLWPENLPAYNIFIEISTQWRSDFNGLVGLDYNVLYKNLDRKLLHNQITDVQYDWIFEDVRALESAHMDEMARQQAKNRSNKP